MPTLRRVVRRIVPARLRPVLRRQLLPRLNRWSDRLSPPVVSVVVTARGRGQHLAECLASLGRQTQRRVEVIVVDDGTLTGSAGAGSGALSRVRVVKAQSRGTGGARNAGARRARGTYLAFVDADDTLPAVALRTLVRSLERSGSDFAVGAVHRVRLGRSTRPAWLATVHDVDRRGVTLDEFPAAMQDVLPYNRLYRRSFWRDRVGGYPEGTDYGDSVATVTALIRAGKIDVLKAVTYAWHQRVDPRSLVQGRTDREQMDDHLGMLERTWRLLTAEASAGITAAWLGGVLDTQLTPYLDHAGREDEAYRERLGRSARAFVAAADEQVWGHVRLHQRLRVWLAARQQWRGLEQCTEFLRLDGPIPVTRVRDGQVYAEVPPIPELRDFPSALLELPPLQTELSACISHARWQDDTLVLDGWAFVRSIDLTELSPAVEAWLEDPATAERVPVRVEASPTKEANRWANQRHQDVEHSGFTAYLDSAQLPRWDGAGGSRTWQLRLRIDAAGVARTGTVRSVLLNGIGHRMPPRRLHDDQDPGRVVPIVDPGLGFCLQQRVEPFRARELQVAAGGRVEGRLSVLGARPPALVRVRASSPGGRVEALLRTDDDGLASFALTLPSGDARQWTFLAVDEQGKGRRVPWPVESRAGTVVSGSGVDGGSGGVRWSRSPRGFCELSTGFTAVEVTGIDVTETALVVHADLCGLTVDEVAEAVLTSGKVTVPAAAVAATGPGRARLEFPLTTDVWGEPDRPLPPAGYRLLLPGRNLAFSPRADLLDQLPREGTTRTHGYRIARRPSRTDLVVTLFAPLAPDERGRLAQQRLAEWYDRTEFAPTESVLFQCYRGEFATDSQRAIHEELRRQGSPLELLWAVSDHSVALPEGAVPLLIGSRAWYAAVGRSRYLCHNIDFDRFFRRRPYQRYLQTFHGYPFKSMGISLWRAQGKAESVIEAEVERRTSAWTSLLVPSEPCVEMYRREYRYDGEILVTGYPRNDGLVGADVGDTRARVRARLGIDPEQTVVLYAPTWRDTVATGAWKAKLFDELDLDRLAETLGEEFAVLLRGHNYNLREGGTGRTAAVLDVSSYPEVNDLVLAADVAVLDYSSLRFDWLLTEKPALFFVPDLEDYLSARTVLFDYRSSAPGPLLRTTAEVIAALQDLPAVSAAYAAARRDFNVTFNGLHDGKASKRVVDAFFTTADGPDGWSDRG